ncbi:MAG: SGNH/GDSL hydrolase family protein [Verrucomicrobia bacterium]|nr:SGNH/GDSL hydrolase family protein [Verrucomicrobiota bacterium]
MKSLARIAVLCFLLVSSASPAGAAFTSLYIFGDGVSTTTNGPGGKYYHGNRYCNGRVWVEVLAQRQGIVYDPSRNWSYFGHYSPNLVTNVNKFSAPADANTALFVVWVNNADFVYNINHYAPYTSNNLATWNNAIHRSVTNHLQVIQTLHAKGARTLVMPNTVDLTKVPYYVGLPAASRSFVRQRIVDFNAAFAGMLNEARASLPGITIHAPDTFALLEELLAQSATYGLTNVLQNGLSVDALSDPSLTDKSLNGPGANYIFWDYLDPTARAHAVIADSVHHLISPVRIGKITPLHGSNVLEVINLPIGRDGFVEASANLANWSITTNVHSAEATQDIAIALSGSLQFYRLRFPFSWSWP